MRRTKHVVAVPTFKKENFHFSKKFFFSRLEFYFSRIFSVLGNSSSFSCAFSLSLVPTPIPILRVFLQKFYKNLFLFYASVLLYDTCNIHIHDCACDPFSFHIDSTLYSNPQTYLYMYIATTSLRISRSILLLSLLLFSRL